MANPANMGTLIGRLARDPQVFENADGSKKVLFTVFVDRNYKNASGERGSDAIPVEAFVSKTASSLGAYAMIHKGDLVAVQTTLQAQSWERNGQRVYETKVISENVQFLEPKSVTQARLTERVAAAQAAVEAEHPAAAGTAVEAPVETEQVLQAELPFS